MGGLLDQILLILYGMAAMFTTENETEAIIALLIGVIAASACFLWEGKMVGWMVSVVTAVIACFYVPMIFFLPLIIYGLLRIGCEWSLVLWLIPIAQNMKLYKPLECFLVLLGAAISVWFCKKTKEYQRLLEESRKLQDYSVVKELWLAEKNRNLIEKQDAETYSAVLKERNRIAREIHDNVGHVLSRALIMVGALKTINKEETMKMPLKQLEDSLSAAMTSIRESVHDLHDESMNLEDVLQSLIQEFEFCPVSMTYDMGAWIPQNVKYCFIAIVKEALVNVRKHSRATQVTITARSHPAMYQLIIEDNGTAGRGFYDEKDTIPDTSGIGLKNMQERVRLLNGNFQVMREKGFRIFITVPRESGE